MPFPVSDRLSGLVQSDIRQMTRECLRVGGINMGQGVCDLPTPPLVRDGAIAAIEGRKSIYSAPEGVRRLREAIGGKLERDNGITINSDNQIVVTIGATGGYATALMALFNPGDGILIFEPYYGYHVNTAILAGVEPHYCTLTAPEFTVTKENILSSLKPNTKAIVVCTPSNPSGKMWTKEEIKIIEEIANEKDLLVITDEIYEYYRYENHEHISPASFEGLKDRTITLMGLSKTFSITGWRLGYVVAPEALAQPISLANDLFYVCAPTPLQYGVAEGFKSPPEYFDQLRAEFAEKRAKFCGALDEAGFTPIVPNGAYYVLADVSRLGLNDSRAAAMEILERGKVASIPGRAFHQSEAGKNIVRFCFAIDDEPLEEACRRLKAF